LSYACIHLAFDGWVDGAETHDLMQDVTLPNRTDNGRHDFDGPKNVLQLAI